MANKDRQSTTEIDNAYVALSESDKLLVDMAVNNVPYKEIAREANLAYATVRTLFATGGRLHEAYLLAMAAKRELYKEEFKKIDEYIKEGAVDSVYTLLNAAKMTNMVGVMAARDLLDRAGFKPTEKIENTGIPTVVNINVRKYESKNKPSDE